MNDDGDFDPPPPLLKATFVMRESSKAHKSTVNEKREPKQDTDCSCKCASPRQQKNLKYFPDGSEVSIHTHASCQSEKKTFLDEKRFSKDYVQITCETLINTGNLSRLHRFLWALDECYRNLEIVLIARAYIAYQTLNFRELHDILTKNKFERKYHQQLIMMWMKAKSILRRGIDKKQKLLEEKLRENYENRSVHVEKDGNTYYFSRETRTILNEVYEKTIYPSSAEKNELAKKTKLTVTQVSNWFKNKRQRARAHEEKPKSLPTELKATHMIQRNTEILPHQNDDVIHRSEYTHASKYMTRDHLDTPRFYVRAWQHN